MKTMPKKLMGTYESSLNGLSKLKSDFEGFIEGIRLGLGLSPVPARVVHEDLHKKLARVSQATKEVKKNS